MTFEELDWARRCGRAVSHRLAVRSFRVLAVVDTGTGGWQPECSALALIQTGDFKPLWERGAELSPAA